MYSRYNGILIKNLNESIKEFDNIYPIEKNYKLSFSSINRMVMLDRYSQKDRTLKTLKVGDLVIAIIKDDPVFPTRVIGFLKKYDNNDCYIKVDSEYFQFLTAKQQEKQLIKVLKSKIEKPLEIFYEQIAKRVSYTLSKNETEKYQNDLYEELINLNIVPAGRILYGAGSKTNVTFFNCFVMPMIKDSRSGISQHRKEVMEIMSHGGGVGTNGSTLRPKGTIAKSVGGRSSGAVSWLNDLSSLTHLVEQGGSRRGAQMIMLSDWHPDVIEFIVSKMQNPKILLWLLKNSKNELIRKEAENKIKLVPITNNEIELYEYLKIHNNFPDKKYLQKLEEKINNQGSYEVINKKFLTGANISINISDKFMDAVFNDLDWELKFPDLQSYNKVEKKFYDEKWSEIGDVWKWEELGYKVKVYNKIKARELWDLINFCANYSAEPGIFFIDRANKMTNASGYGMKVVATNPCGEQPLAPYSVCNLSAINLANFVDKKEQKVLWDKLENTVKNCVRMQDNVIDETNYFLEHNRIQALGERRVGLGVMGLHDFLIWKNLRYGSKEALIMIDKLFKKIAIIAYRESITLAKEKGSFPFLKDNSKFIKTGYVKQLPADLRADILKYGIRNSHLLTIAPTGSTGTMVGVSTGLEPYFAFEYFRSSRLGKNIKVKANIVLEWLKYNPSYLNKKLPDIFVSAMELSPEEHVDVQCTIQKWVDSSISKTVNAPRGYSVKQVQKIYESLYKKGAKGGTVYVDGSRDSQVLSIDNTEDSKDKKNIEKQLVIKDVSIIEDKNEADSKYIPKFRTLKQDREIGIKIGNLCQICKEGTIVEMGGCSTCNNCNAQIKCGL